MVIRAEVGDSPHLGVLILLSIDVPFYLFLSHVVVVAALIPLAIGVNYQGTVMVAGVAILLHLPLLLALVAGHVGVPGGIAIPLAVSIGQPIGVCLLGEMFVASTDNSDLLDLLLSELLPDYCLSLFWGLLPFRVAIFCLHLWSCWIASSSLARSRLLTKVSFLAPRIFSLRFYQRLVRNS